ncbi:unnamed protein product [Phaedon cochleariae]|uniref:Lipase domain-containing protein n=1 Tax=Phaedon cochleariae TaxID=80249 RepID=A0A9P0DA99_PHACE|nr:unnamed protein product [Phaedon cochleariae]
MNKSAILLITFLCGIILISVLTAVLVYFPVSKSSATDGPPENGTLKYSREMMQKEYPGLGTDYVIFEGDNGEKIYAYLKGDGPMQGYDLFNNLNVFTTLVASASTDLSYIQDVFSVLEEIVSFTLYTREHPEGIKVESLEDVADGFNATRKTKFITHGWMSSGSSETCMNIKEGFLNRSDVNVFIMDWSLVADVIVYPVPAAATRPISVYLAEFVNYLIEYVGVDPIDVHFVGHSLGAHISGFAGRQIRAGKIGRITGLDPALPLFDSNPEERINHNDSHFVDIIHTCAGFLGIEDAIGHADFYPNGGTAPQPGCSYFDLTESCSHGKSWKLFAKSITIPDPLLACKDKKDKKQCEDGVPMGEPTPSHARGTYYLKTD